MGPLCSAWFAVEAHDQLSILPRYEWFPLSATQLTTTLHLSRSSAAKYDFTFKKYQAAS